MADRLVNRLKNTNFAKFCELVEMHLSFLLDLSGSSLEEFTSPEHSSTHQTITRILHIAKKPKETPTGIFGNAVNSESLERIQPIVEFLKKPESLHEEGLFRKSGQALRQKNLQENLDTGDIEQLKVDLQSGVYTAHDCASVLKLYLRELPEPLLTTRHYIAYCQAASMTCPLRQLHTLQLLSHLLPQHSYLLLQSLLDLLHLVIENTASNKMTAESLATLLAPHLLVPRSISATELQTHAAAVTAILAKMITKQQTVFEYPESLVTDIALYWEDMEGENTTDEADAVKTIVCFADRNASVGGEDYTQQQVAQLYAYVHQMPESPYKRKLVKQFTKHARTPIQSKSLGDSIKKVIGRTPKRKHSYDVTQQELIDSHNETYTPVNDITPLRSTFRSHIESNMQFKCRKLSMNSCDSLCSTESVDSAICVDKENCCPSSDCNCLCELVSQRSPIKHKTSDCIRV